MNKDLANRLREVLLNGKWIANTNFKEQILSISWEQAIKKVDNLNTIALLTFHVNYYIKGLLNVFEGGNLEIKDKFSFDMPEITSEKDWINLVHEFLSNSEKFINHVEEMDVNILKQTFVKEEYGSYLRNIEAQIEHSYYHLGQVSLIKKLVVNLTEKNSQLKALENLKIIKTTELDNLVKQKVLSLWNSEYPEKLSYHSLGEFDLYLQGLKNLSHFLLTENLDEIFGWALTFERDNEKWFAIIIAEEVQGKGLGRKMLNKLKQTEPILNGWVIDHYNDKKKNGLMYVSPLKFYEKCGFEILTDIRLELNKISAVKIKWTNGEL
jgi:GNAT superfamily N-acetyltransferase